MKKFVSLCLVAIMLISVLVSCNDTSDADDTVSTDVAVENTTEKNTTEPVTEAVTESDVPVAGYDLSKFVIVYGELCNMQIATDLREKIKSEFNVNLSMKRATSTNEAEFELIIGESPREVSSRCFDITDTKYLTASGIVCDNGKVQLLGIDRATIDASINCFVSNHLNKDTLLVSLPENGEDIEVITHESISIPEKADASHIRLVTNNILSQNLNASWDRISGLIGAYVYLDADICAFQEVDKPWHSTYGLTDRMQWLGYSLVTDNTNSPNPIFYKTEKFDLVAGGYDKYDIELVEGTEDRYYSWACLKEKATGKQFIVIGTHLLSSGSGMMPERYAASVFSLRPPIARTLPRRVISPVIAISRFTGMLPSALTIAVTIVTPADGPSFGIAPSGKWMCISESLWKSGFIEYSFATVLT